MKAKNATTKRVNYATNNKLLYGNAEAKQEDRGSQGKDERRERERHLPLSAHACDPNQLREREMIKFSAFEANWIRVRHVFRGKALKAHYVYAMCCISKRNTPTFLSLNLSACRTISLVQKLVRISSALRFFSPSHFFRIFFSITSFALCAFVCVCVSASSICAVSAVGCSLVAFGISFSSACCV